MYSVSPAYSAGATGTFTVTATAKPGFVLSGTSQWTLTVAAKVTGAACVTGGGTLGGNPRDRNRGSVPNTAMDAPMTDQAAGELDRPPDPVGLAYVGRRNLLAARDGR